jgi:dissimilatory sulfite reductase (desulfoviridin) alpha/beta subunit
MKMPIGDKFALIERCRGCPNAVVDPLEAETVLAKVIEETGFEERQKERLKTGSPLYHQVFRIAIAGCPNSCSQPQIKDFGVQGQARPGPGEGCTGCGECVAACPDGLIRLSESGPVIDFSRCLNCALCVRACPAEALKVDQRGYKILIGGKLGRRPRLASTMARLGNEAELAAALKKAFMFLLEHGRPHERLGDLVDRCGNVNILPKT